MVISSWIRLLLFEFCGDLCIHPDFDCGCIVGLMMYKSKQVSAEAWGSAKCKMPDWTNEADTGVKFNDKSLLSTYKNRKIPMEVAIELYFNEKIDFTDTMRVYLNR
eukprot:885414_1